MFSLLKLLLSVKHIPCCHLYFILILSWESEWHPWCFLWLILYANVASCCEGFFTLKWFITQWVKAMLLSLVLHYFVWKNIARTSFSAPCFFSDYLEYNIKTWLLISVFELTLCLDPEVLEIGHGYLTTPAKSCTVISFCLIHGSLNNDKLHLPILSIASFVMLSLRVLFRFRDQTTIWLSLSSSPRAIALIN